MDVLHEKINNLCSRTIQKLGDPWVLSIVMPIADVMIFAVENPARVATEHRPSKRRVVLYKNFESLEGLLDDDSKLSRVCAQSYLNRAPRYKKRSAQREREGSKWMH